jgi:hypothetical protein
MLFMQLQGKGCSKPIHGLDGETRRKQFSEMREIVIGPFAKAWTRFRYMRAAAPPFSQKNYTINRTKFKEKTKEWPQGHIQAQCAPAIERDGNALTLWFNIRVLRRGQGRAVSILSGQNRRRPQNHKSLSFDSQFLMYVPLSPPFARLT